MENIEDKLEHLKDGIALQLTKINMNMINHSNLKDKIIIDKKYLDKKLIEILIRIENKCNIIHRNILVIVAGIISIALGIGFLY